MAFAVAYTMPENDFPVRSHDTYRKKSDFLANRRGIPAQSALHIQKHKLMLCGNTRYPATLTRFSRQTNQWRKLRVKRSHIILLVLFFSLGTHSLLLLAHADTPEEMAQWIYETCEIDSSNYQYTETGENGPAVDFEPLKISHAERAICDQYIILPSTVPSLAKIASTSPIGDASLTHCYLTLESLDNKGVLQQQTLEEYTLDYSYGGSTNVRIVARHENGKPSCAMRPPYFVWSNDHQK
jgi:hypothetical protein